VDALRDLQLAAALFTVQMASNDHGDLAALQPFKDKLEALPEHREAVARIMDGHDSTVATRTLAHSAIDYTRQVIIAEDNDAPIGSNGMGRALNDLQIAAFTFTVQIAISEGHDPKAMRRIEKKLVAMFTRQGAS
jgi:hypothetical protein